MVIVTGDKRAARPLGQRTPSATPVRAFPKTAIAIALGSVALAGAATVFLAALPERGVPPAALDPDFAE